MELVIFKVAEKEYGADLKQIRQVIRMREVTQIPDAAKSVEGVISLRGRVVPLVSLRKKMGAEEKEISRWSRIIVTETDSAPVGVVVDTVLGVVTLEPGSITPPDEVLKDAGYLTGVARLDKRLILVIDIEKLLSLEDKDGIRKVHSRVEVKKKDRGRG
jgi:purine-binding chemotaxis protein CheW